MPGLADKSFSTRHSQRLLQGNSLAETVHDCRIVVSEFRNPVRKALSLVADRIHRSVTAIACLLFIGRPAAVARFVVAVVIYTINGMVGTSPRPHVGKEILKRLSPSFANYDATTAIVTVSRIRLVVATGDHGPPNVVFRQSVLPSISMLVVQDHEPLSPNAATRRCAASSQIDATHNCGLSTVARAIPVCRFFLNAFRAINNYESPKTLSSDVNESNARLAGIASLFFASHCSRFFQASARLSCPAFQRIGTNRRCISAIAAAFPEMPPASRCGMFDDNQPADSLAREIGSGRLTISHKMFLFLEGRLWLEPASVHSLVRLASF